MIKLRLSLGNENCKRFTIKALQEVTKVLHLNYILYFFIQLTRNVYLQLPRPIIFIDLWSFHDCDWFLDISDHFRYLIDPGLFIWLQVSESFMKYCDEGLWDLRIDHHLLDEF